MPHQRPVLPTIWGSRTPQRSMTPHVHRSAVCLRRGRGLSRRRTARSSPSRRRWPAAGRRAAPRTAAPRPRPPGPPRTGRPAPCGMPTHASETMCSLRLITSRSRPVDVCPRGRRLSPWLPWYTMQLDKAVQGRSRARGREAPVAEPRHPRDHSGVVHNCSSIFPTQAGKQ